MPFTIKWTVRGREAFATTDRRDDAEAIAKAVGWHYPATVWLGDRVITQYCKHERDQHGRFVCDCWL